MAKKPKEGDTVRIAQGGAYDGRECEIKHASKVDGRDHYVVEIDGVNAGFFGDEVERLGDE